MSYLLLVLFFITLFFFFFLLSFIFACDGLCDCDMRFASPTYKKWLTRQRNLSSSEVRASVLEHGVSWVRIPSGAQIFFCVLLWLILYISLYFLYNINISRIGELPINLNFSFRFIFFLRHLQRLTYFDDLDMEDNRRLSFFHVVPNSTFRMKFWPQWVSLIQASYHGDLKGMYYSRIIGTILFNTEVYYSEINKIDSGAVHVRNRPTVFFSFFQSGFLTS